MQRANGKYKDQLVGQLTTTFGDKTILDDLNSRASLKKMPFVQFQGSLYFDSLPLKTKQRLIL